MALVIRDAKDGKEIPLDQFCRENKYCLFIPKPDVPFSLLEAKIKEQASSSRYQLLAPQFRFPDLSPAMKHASPGVKRLYYTVLLVSSDSQLVQLAGVDPMVRPPQFDIDFNRLVEKLDLSKYKDGAVVFYTIFVDEDGAILGIEDRGFSHHSSAIVDALSKSCVIKPGLRNGLPVPTAVILAIRVPPKL